MIREDDTVMICDYTGYDLDESVPKHGNSPFPLQKDALQEVFQKKDREQRRACLGLKLIDVPSDGKSEGMDYKKINPVARQLILFLFHEAGVDTNFQKRSLYLFEKNVGRCSK
ncbi:MAG: hypothetical protein SPH80_04405 [Peptoniphilaceae bacterium]|nr:hypothetical protein [Peptoniphilaceae bacterium]